MDPITTAIVAALTTGMVAGAAKVAEKSIVDGYDALKAALRKKRGSDSDVVNAVEELEKKPESAARRAVLQEEVAAAKAEQDPDLVEVAEALLAKIEELPGGRTAITQIVKGDRNIFSGAGNVTVTGREQE